MIPIILLVSIAKYRVWANFSDQLGALCSRLPILFTSTRRRPARPASVSRPAYCVNVMNFHRFIYPAILVTAAFGIASPGNQARAQDLGQPVAADDRVSLFAAVEPADHPSQNHVARTGMTPQELRTARAIYRTNQRVARLEHNLWIGHEPLRPRWNSIPMMTSRYSNPKFYVPVYIYNR